MMMRDDESRRVMRNDAGWGWGLPALIAAVVLIGGLLLFNSGDNRTTTANNTGQTTTTSTTGPAGSQAPVRVPTTTPAPATTPLKQ